jgi:hypothetical protein
MIKLSSIKPNPDNPRVIKDERFQRLKQSIQDFPKMMALRPMVIDDQGMILGGNMRLKALQDLGFKEVPNEWVKQAAELTEEEKQRFIIADNVGFGDWSWDILSSSWDVDQLSEWGLDVPEFAPEVDYSILDDEDLQGDLTDMANGVKKAIQIEFEAEHYEEAAALVKFWRDKGGYVGGMIMEYLKAEKDKL